MGKRLAVINCKKREAKKREEQAQLERTTSRVNQYYGIGAVMALGVIGGLGHYISWSKKGEQLSSNPQQNNPKPCPQAIATQLPSEAQPAQTNKFEMD